MSCEAERPGIAAGCCKAVVRVPSMFRDSVGRRRSIPFAATWVVKECLEVDRRAGCESEAPRAVVDRYFIVS